MPKKVSVLGWYSHGNVGDESYKNSFPLLFPNCLFSFSDKVDNSADVCVLGGGNVASDFFLDKLLAFPGKKAALSISVMGGEHFSRLKELDAICVRDMHSFEYLRKVGVSSVYVPDFAFMMKPDPKVGRDYIVRNFKEQKHDLYKKVIAVTFSSYLVGDNKWLAREHLNFERVVFELSGIFDNTAASFIFIPFCTMSPNDDRVSNSWLASRCKFYNKNVVIYDPLHPQQALDVISACDAVISSRLHSSIFSTLAGVPFIDLTHHDKNMSFLSSIYLSDWSVSYWHFDFNKFNNLLKEFLLHKQEYNAKLNVITRQCKDILSGVKKHVPFLE